MRIIGGKHRGRVLTTPKGDIVRPTSDKVRAALFNILTHGVTGFDLEGAHVLDLFAGTGALGFEALSRGAASCVFVENALTSRALIQENMTNLGFGGAARIFRRDATKLGAATRSASFNLIFADPPYGKGLAEAALASAIQGRWLANHALIVLEERASVEVTLPNLIMCVDNRFYGDTQIIIGRYIASDEESFLPVAQTSKCL